MRDTASTAALVFRLLHTVDHEAAGSALAQALGMVPSQMEPLLQQWTQDGLLMAVVDKPGHYLCAPKAARMMLSETAWRNDPREISAILSNIEDGRDFPACEGLLAHIDNLLGRSKVAGALLCFDVVLRIMHRLAGKFSGAGLDEKGASLHEGRHAGTDWALPATEAQRSQSFVTAVLNAADISMYLTKFHNETRILCVAARDVAYAIGNERDAVLLHLVESCLENMAAECTPARMLELHTTCENALMHLKTRHSPLGDETVSIQAAYFMGMFHFWHGRFQDVLLAFEEAQKYPQIWKGRFQTEMFPLYTSSAALYLGRHHQAVGILEAARRAAVLDQDRFKTMWWEAQLGVVLLYMGHLEEALELFDPVIARADPESETKILHWGMRGLACYHFMRGHIRSSHTVMQDAMAMARRNGFRRPIFSYPWMFDMLHAYEKAGLPPIEGLCLDEELLRATEGYNQHLRAAALRTQAERLLLRGNENRSEAVRLLQLSLNDFRRSGNPHEQERTSTLLHQVTASSQPEIRQPRSSRGHDRSSASAAMDSNEVPPLHGEQQAAQIFSENRAMEEWLPQLENNCRLALNSIQSITDLPRYACQVTYIASCELGAERAALFRIGTDGTLHAEAWCNMSQAEMGTGQLASSLAGMEQALVAPQFLEDVDHVSLILPLDLDSAGRWLLYLESQYAVKPLSLIPAEMQESIMHIFAHDLRNVVQLQEKNRHSTIADQRETAQAEPYRDSPEVLLHGSPLTRRVLSHARQIAATDAPVLILGETGVGKELLAKYIHDCSGLSGNFVPVHPASIPEGLFESEFFGHERGAFTGAHKQKVGLAEMAHQGTLFIDEVGDIPPPMQVKLLRVFQDRRFMRVGGNAEIRSEFRLVGATNKDLWQEVQAGNFREDLYYRMAVVPLSLPPLRERPEDILVLARRFIDRFARRYHRSIGTVTEQDLAELLAYDWPGNVRELKSVIERALILHREGKLDFALHAASQRCHHRAVAECPPAPSVLPASLGQAQPAPFHEGVSGISDDLPTVDELLARYIRRVLQHTNGRITGPRGALGILGMKRSTLYARMKQYGIDSK